MEVYEFYYLFIYLFTFPEESRSALKVDLCGLYAEENAKSHQTSKFEITQQGPESGGIPPSPVLRRGLPFYMTVRFDRPYNPEIDTIRIHFYFGNFILLSIF